MAATAEARKGRGDSELGFGLVGFSGLYGPTHFSCRVCANTMGRRCGPNMTRPLCRANTDTIGHGPCHVCVVTFHVGLRAAHRVWPIWPSIPTSAFDSPASACTQQYHTFWFCPFILLGAARVLLGFQHLIFYYLIKKTKNPDLYLFFTCSPPPSPPPPPCPSPAIFIAGFVVSIAIGFTSARPCRRLQ